MDLRASKKVISTLLLNIFADVNADSRSSFSESDSDDRYDDDAHDDAASCSDASWTSSESDFSTVMDEMDKELFQSLKVDHLTEFPAGFASTEEQDENMVRNWLQSLSEQEGGPGPVGNILRQMGIFVHKDPDGE